MKYKQLQNKRVPAKVIWLSEIIWREAVLLSSSCFNWAESFTILVVDLLFFDFDPRFDLLFLLFLAETAVFAFAFLDLVTVW